MMKFSELWAKYKASGIRSLVHNGHEYLFHEARRFFPSLNRQPEPISFSPCVLTQGFKGLSAEY